MLRCAPASHQSTRAIARICRFLRLHGRTLRETANERGFTDCRGSFRCLSYFRGKSGREAGGHGASIDIPVNRGGSAAETKQSRPFSTGALFCFPFPEIGRSYISAD